MGSGGRARAESGGQRLAATQARAEEQEDRRLWTWPRVRLGGERRVDFGRADGYKDGSAITHLLKLLAEDKAVQRLLTPLEAEYANRVSRVDPHAASSQRRGWQGPAAFSTVLELSINCSRNHGRRRADT
jgi:hypothetical protein